MLRNYLSYGVTLLAIAALVVVASKHPLARADTSITVSWLLSHQPVDVFANATTVFAQTLARETNGEMILKIVTPQDVGVTSGDVPNSEIFQALDAGKVQLASAYTVALGQQDPQMWTLTLPYLFRDYPSALRSLDGAAAQKILDGFAPVDARALAFTMSGGFRIIASRDRKIESLSDMKGLRIATSGGPVAQATLSALGAIPVPVDLESGSHSFDANSIDAVETTYSRLGEVLGSQSPYTRYISETNHSMFLTAIVVSASFYNSLSPRNQAALRDAARAAAVTERQDSIALAGRVRDELRAQGSTITALSASSTAAFAAATKPVYATFASNADLIGNLSQ